MQLWQALILGALQGVAELFPVSSLAHTILIPAILGWNLDQQQNYFLSFVVALHLATALALVLYFWREWRSVLLAYLGSFKRRQLVYDAESKFAWLLVAGTIPVGLVGVIFEKKLRSFFEDPRYFWMVALFLILNGLLMLYGEYLRKKSGRRELEEEPSDFQRQPVVAVGDGTVATLSGMYTQPAVKSAKSSPVIKQAQELTFVQGAAIGASQILALLPGFSRSGATMVAGLWARLSHEEAARFGFMLATPVIGLAALLKIPELFKPEARAVLNLTIPSAVVAGVVAYLSVRFLMKYFETRRLSPFAYYCLGFGFFSLVVLLVRGV
ncbi:MAG TPA: undecaprenyl-diphosphate phosphatase [Chloroflexia bacterium]|nr:undecaprenyl-diphosphate phosphatase [Chloroflexia bacterium]